MTPIFVLAGELETGEVTCDACHGHGTRPIRLPKVKVKRIVLDILIPRVVLVKLVRPCRADESMKGERILTVCTAPPDRWPATAFDIDGFSATHKTLISALPALVWRRQRTCGLPHQTLVGLMACQMA